MNNDPADRQSLLNRMLALSLQLPFTGGVYQTQIPFLTVLKEIKPTQVAHGVLRPSFCIVLQGSKKVQAGKETLEYGTGHYLAASIDMPVNGQVAKADAEFPYAALRIELAPEEVAEVALEAKMNIRAEKGSQTGIFVGETSLEVLEAFERLLRLSADPRAANFLAAAVKREIIYRLLDGKAGALFYRNMLLHQEAAGISRVIGWITDHFDSPFTIGELAGLGNMSVSNLHRKFKEVTAMAPLQYQKRLRLQEAQRLLLEGTFDVTEAALHVGYYSPTQFIREYKRLYGLSPFKDVRMIRDGKRYSPEI